MDLRDVQDAVFASEALGKGIAVIPEKGEVVAPEDCLVSLIFPTKHAIGLTLDNGAELLIHIGMNTVELQGQHFTQHVEAGTRVAKGTKIVSFDMEAIRAAGYDITVPVIVSNTEDFEKVSMVANDFVNQDTDSIYIHK